MLLKVIIQKFGFHFSGILAFARISTFHASELRILHASVDLALSVLDISLFLNLVKGFGHHWCIINLVILLVLFLNVWHPRLNFFDVIAYDFIVRIKV